MHVTERVVLEIGQHRETLRFIVVPSNMEEIVLNLSWLDKWGSMICCGVALTTCG